jgi:hypothetical protein
MVTDNKPASDKRKPNIIPSYNQNNNNTYYDNKSVYDKTIELAVEGLTPFFESLLRERTIRENALFIAEYNIASMRETNISSVARKNNIQTLLEFTEFLSQKDFREMAREDVLLYLDSLRRPDASDPLHRWIGTYNLRRVIIVRFFKWLYNPGIEPDKRAKPSVVEIYLVLREERNRLTNPQTCGLQKTIYYS